MEKQEVAKMLDHTLLKADATHEQLRAVCNEAKQYGVAAVCVLMKMQGIKELELHYTSMFWNMQKV